MEESGCESMGESASLLNYINTNNKGSMNYGSSQYGQLQYGQQYGQQQQQRQGNLYIE